MKKTYEKLTFTPVCFAPECEILAGSLKMLAENVTVQKYEDGFDGIDGAISGFGGSSFSDLEF